ncbi:MAG: response regulator [Eubacteriales bacterium]|jgi:two-component system chemotaxis response regulator CheY|nr:response regulator [Bacillota bacterium]MBV1728390.1 response regulator [Desulforudis sp.]MDQ7789838.1 response regulator [Clostridia bacterium]MDZ4042412.1 response regulator [Eubacteriales bacterium]MBU4555183.1 response regulator [Bacillota bacterium]
MKPIRILVCDDSLLVRSRLKESLRQCGDHEVFEAKDGQGAVDLYKQHLPELVFLDIVMPEKDGLEALHLIKQFDAAARVVIVSSAGTQSHLRKAIEAGATDFIQKPWEQKQVESIIARVLSERDEQHV